MKHSSGSKTPKSDIIKALKDRDLTMSRVTDAEGRRVWKLSDGRTFESLAQIAKQFSV